MRVGGDILRRPSVGKISGGLLAIKKKPAEDRIAAARSFAGKSDVMIPPATTTAQCHDQAIVSTRTVEDMRERANPPLTNKSSDKLAIGNRRRRTLSQQGVASMLPAPRY